MYELSNSEAAAVCAAGKAGGQSSSAYNQAMGSASNPCSPQAFVDHGMSSGMEGAGVGFSGGAIAGIVSGPFDPAVAAGGAVGDFLSGALMGDAVQGAECASSLLSKANKPKAEQK